MVHRWNRERTKKSEIERERERVKDCPTAATAIKIIKNSPAMGCAVNPNEGLRVAHLFAEEKLSKVLDILHLLLHPKLSPPLQITLGTINHLPHRKKESELKEILITIHIGKEKREKPHYK